MSSSNESYPTSSSGLKSNEVSEVVFFTKYEREGASSRVRTYQNLWAFERENVCFSISALLTNQYVRSIGSSQKSVLLAAVCYLNRLVKLVRMRLTGNLSRIYWIEKELFPYVPASIEFALIGSTPYVVDYDDAIFHKYDLAKNRIIRRLLGAKIDRLMSRSAIVVAGNEYLANRALRAGASKVVIIPSTIVFQSYRMARNQQPPSTGATRIVWIGSPTTARYLELLREPLKRLAREFAIEFVVIGADPPRDLKAPVLTWKWSEQDEVNQIAACQIGVMPLEDSEWERGKCGYKLIQYMAAGLPVVCSPVGVNEEILSKTNGGLLARTPDDWYRALKRLIQHSTLRDELGSRGRASVKSLYSSESRAPELVSCAEHVIEQRKVSTR